MRKADLEKRLEEIERALAEVVAATDEANATTTLSPPDEHRLTRAIEQLRAFVSPTNDRPLIPERRSLEERQAVALERIADALDGTRERVRELRDAFARGAPT